MLEAGQHEHNSFVTLTLEDEHYPSDGCVSVPTAQMFLRRLRSRVGKVRYAIIGEYGERTWRAHYHALLFGLRDGSGVRESWPYGYVHISGVGVESAAYVAGYTLKGAYNKSGMEWHKKNLHPEFVRRSLKPGLGASAADLIGNFYITKTGSAIARDVGVSSVIRSGQQLWPLGRYLRTRAQNSAGLDQATLTRLRSLESAMLLKGMNQTDLNQMIHTREGLTERSGFRAEERYKRKSLEKKL